MPEGSPVKRPVCRIHLECPYYTGPYLAVALNKPAQQVYLGPIPGSKPFPGTAAALSPCANTKVPQSPPQETSVPCPAPLQAVEASLPLPPEAQDTAAPPPANCQDVDVPPLHPASLGEPSTLPVDRAKFAADQRVCATLKAWCQLATSGLHQVQNKGCKAPQYVHYNGLLYQRTVSGDQECLRLCVPQCHRRNIISWAHHNSQHGHLDPAATLEKVRKFYVWPYLHAEVSRYAKACLLCQTLASQCHSKPPAGRTKRPGIPRRPSAGFHQALPHCKPWVSFPHYNHGAYHAPRGPKPPKFQVPPARHPLANYAPDRRSHPRLLPRALGVPPDHVQASPYYLRRT